MNDYKLMQIFPINKYIKSTNQNKNNRINTSFYGKDVKNVVVVENCLRPLNLNINLLDKSLQSQITQLINAKEKDYTKLIIDYGNKIQDSILSDNTKNISSDLLLKQINQGISFYITRIKVGAELLGEECIKWAINNFKLARFEKLMNDTYTFHNNSYDKRQLLLEKTNPAESFAYKELKRNLEKIEIEMHAPEYQDFYTLHNRNKRIIQHIEERIKECKKNKNIKAIKPLLAGITELRKKEFEAKSELLKNIEGEKTKIKAQINKLLSNALKDPQRKIEAFHLHKAFAENSILEQSYKLNQYLTDEPFKTNIPLQNLINSELKILLKLDDEQLNAIYKQKINESPYFYKILALNKTPLNNFKTLLSILAKEENPKKAFNNLEQNKTTKNLFDNAGIDYEIWTDINRYKDVFRINDNAFIRKIDMDDVGNSLFLGNQVHCCTSIGEGVRARMAPNYVMNKFIQAFELVVNNESVGNTMCYIAKFKNSEGYDKYALVLDNLEVLAPYKENLSYVEGFINFAQKFSKKITSNDIEIWIGCHNKFFQTQKKFLIDKNFNILGNSGEQEIHLDSIKTMSVMNERVIDDKNYVSSFYTLETISKLLESIGR